MLRNACAEDPKQVNDFIHALAELMQEHGVWMNVGLASDSDSNDPRDMVVEFNALEDINDCESETKWFIELTDMWPDEYEIVDEEYGVVPA